MAGIADDIERLIPHLRRFSRALVRGNDVRDADDLVQHTVVAALRANGVTRGADLTTWCLTTLIRFHRHRRGPAPKVRSAIGVTDWGGNGGQARSASAPPLPAAVALPLDALALEAREVLLLVVLAGFEYTQAASLLEVPTEVVIARLTEARNTLAAGWPAQSQGAAGEGPSRPTRATHLRIVK